MAIDISLKKSTINPTSASGLTMAEPVFNRITNTLWMGKGSGVAPVWLGAGICGASAGIATGLTLQTPTCSAVKDYVVSFINGSGFTYTAETPVYSPTVGDRWMDSDTGVEYVWIDDGTSTQWVQPTNTAQNSTSKISILQTVSITGATYSATPLDYYIGVSYAGQSVVTLPTNPETGREMVVKDESGHAGDNINRWITICGASPTKIDNQDTAVLNISNGALQFIYRNGWRII
jgi:hypothetical protein